MTVYWMPSPLVDTVNPFAGKIVMPAQAGIQDRSPVWDASLDSHLRGNDGMVGASLVLALRPFFPAPPAFSSRRALRARHPSPGEGLYFSALRAGVCLVSTRRSTRSHESINSFG